MLQLSAEELIRVRRMLGVFDNLEDAKDPATKDELVDALISLLKIQMQLLEKIYGNRNSISS